MLPAELLTGMLLSAHLIIFWFSGQQCHTASLPRLFAAAGIAGTRPIPTGLTSWKVAKGLYLVPILFAYSPLISGSWPERLGIFLWASMGLYAMAGLLQWHLEARITPAAALSLLLSAFLLMWTPLPIYYHAAGALLLIGIVYLQRKGNELVTAPNNLTAT